MRWNISSTVFLTALIAFWTKFDTVFPMVCVCGGGLGLQVICCEVGGLRIVCNLKNYLARRG